MLVNIDLRKYLLDDIPKYVYMRDILNIDIHSAEMKTLKQRVMINPHVSKIVDLQWEDGSWGRFHSMNTTDNSDFTTEKAIRRLLNLGLDKHDLPIIKAVNYMESYLKDELDLRDHKEKKHDWKLLTRLFASTWLLRIDSSNQLALAEARKWADVVSRAFADEEFNNDEYIKVYDEILKPEKNKKYWFIENFYIVSILKGLLDDTTKSYFIKHILNSNKGIYYIYDGNLAELPNMSSIPSEFKSKATDRYLTAIDLLLDYECKDDVFTRLVNHLESKLDDDSLWDMGKSVKDKMIYPLSNSWRKELNRKIDCTIRITKVVNKVLK